MKVRLMTKVSAATLISAIACSIFTGCTEKDLYNPERGKTELKPESEYFDFATTAQVAFDVNYGKIAGGALIEVFTEDPITYQTNNLYSINGEAVFKIFADADGRFTGNVELPKATEKVYIISQSWGAPMYVEADVENGKVVVDMTENNANTRSTAMTRAKSNLTIDLKDRKERVYSIVGWGQSHGEIIDNNDIVTTGNFNDGTLKQLQHTLWKGYDSKPSNMDNRALVGHIVFLFGVLDHAGAGRFADTAIARKGTGYRGLGHAKVFSHLADVYFFFSFCLFTTRHGFTPVNVCFYKIFFLSLPVFRPTGSSQDTVPETSPRPGHSLLG